MQKKHTHYFFRIQNVAYGSVTMGLNRVCGEKITPKYLLTLLQIRINVSFLCMSTNNLSNAKEISIL